MSQCVDSFSYDPVEQILTIDFPGRDQGAHGGGGTYEYLDFSPEEFARFASAASKGSYFNNYIRDQYEYNRVG